MQSSKFLGDSGFSILAEALSAQGHLNDYLLECIKDGKTLDITSAPIQTINYYFTQTISLSLRTRVNSCQSVNELQLQLTQMISAENMQTSIDEFIASSECKRMIESSQKTKYSVNADYIKNNINLKLIECYIRLYYAIEKAARASERLNELAKEGVSYQAGAFLAEIDDHMRHCKDVLVCLTIDMLQQKQKKNIDPVVQFNNFLVRILDEKKICQIQMRDMLLLPVQVNVEEEQSLIRQFPELAQITALQDVGVMLANLAKQNQVGEDWERAKASYTAALRVLENTIQAELLVRQNQELTSFEQLLVGMEQQKSGVSNTADLDNFGDCMMQFISTTSEYEFQQLAQAFSELCKAIPHETKGMARLSIKLNQAVDGLTGKRTGKRASLKEPDTIFKIVDHFLATADAVKKPYEDVIAKFEIFKKLRAEQDQLLCAREMLTCWKAANTQLAFIVETAIQRLRDISAKFQDAEKQQPNMLLDFLKRRWPEITISCGSVGTVGGFGSAFLSLFAGITLPVTVTVAVVVVAGAATGLIVSAVKDKVTPPKTEKEIAMATLGALAVNETQRVEQPAEVQPATGMFARFFGRQAPAVNELELLSTAVMEKKPGSL